MIASLTGQISHLDLNFCILEVNNIGYEVFLPSRSLTVLNLSQQVKFFIHTHVREDQLKLYGFETIEEKQLFELLLEVSGVGPKAAISILSAAKIAEIEKAIMNADVNFFTKIKGLGKKTSQKIIIELKNKLGSLKEIDLVDKNTQFSPDVIDVLQNFGFNKKDIYLVLEKIDSNLSEDEIIKQALKNLSRI